MATCNVKKMIITCSLIPVIGHLCNATIVALNKKKMLVLIHRSRSAGKKAGNWANKRKLTLDTSEKHFL